MVEYINLDAKSRNVLSKEVYGPFIVEQEELEKGQLKITFISEDFDVYADLTLSRVDCGWKIFVHIASAPSDWVNNLYFMLGDIVREDKTKTDPLIFPTIDDAYLGIINVFEWLKKL